MFGFASPQRLDRRLVEGEVVVAPGEDDVEVLELRGRRQDDVGVARGVGHELLEHDGEQVLAAQPGEHPLLVGGDLGRVRVPDDQRLDRRVELGVGERLAELRHVDRARPAPVRRSAPSSSARSATAPAVAVGM